MSKTSALLSDRKGMSSTNLVVRVGTVIRCPLWDQTFWGWPEPSLEDVSKEPSLSEDAKEGVMVLMYFHSRSYPICCKGAVAK